MRLRELRPNYQNSIIKTILDRGCGTLRLPIRVITHKIFHSSIGDTSALIAGRDVAGTPVAAGCGEQKADLRTLAVRTIAVLPTLSGGAEAFGVREDTVRLWRSDFVRSGV
jgi:hypothetical protein